ncbi:hypothetical protein [Streptomyces hygroscopicus]|uniref:hypothetical protein n=1 Tax=Streptomyces hygroscopicus TaxID=1912 RepID=UPI001FCAE5E9|nr:hypothetical protein [Streptomyces hygroscopicus]BDH10487.1 hypothetical protein HOK021_16660 [Streptomyces hygroscopicus]
MEHPDSNHFNPMDEHLLTRERIARAVQQQRTGRDAIRLLLARGIQPIVRRGDPACSSWISLLFSKGETTGTWFDPHPPYRHSVCLYNLPLPHVPRILKSVGGTVDAKLMEFHRVEDYQGAAVQWLGEETGGVLHVLDVAPLPGHEGEYDPPTFVSQLSTSWTGIKRAHVKLSQPGTDARCTVELYGLTRFEARNAVDTYAVQITTD